MKRKKITILYDRISELFYSFINFLPKECSISKKNATFAKKFGQH